MKKLLFILGLSVLTFNIYAQKNTSPLPDTIESGFYSVKIGNLTTEGYFENYLQSGNWLTYFQSGQIQKLEQFKEGKRNGLYMVINRRGYIEGQAEYLDGELSGRKLRFGSGGKVLADESAKSADFKRVLKSYEDFVKINKPWDDISTKNFLDIRS